MLETPIDVPHVWLGVAVVSIAVAGVGAGLPTGTPPDAATAGNTVDRVAASPHPATAEHPIDADRVRIEPHRIALENERGTAHATLAFGPVTPAGDGPLRAILDGRPPERAFDSPEEFRRALVEARERRHDWEPAGDRIVVRSVSWRDVDATIVGA
jgi:hypothetical protein